MRNIRCDRCGAEHPVGERTGYIVFGWRKVWYALDPKDTQVVETKDDPFGDLDFCEKCMREIGEFIKNESEPEEESDDVQETEQWNYNDLPEKETKELLKNFEFEEEPEEEKEEEKKQKRTKRKYRTRKTEETKE